MARTSTEAKYRSLATTSVMVPWLQFLLKELNVPLTTPFLFCDNLCTVALSRNPVLNAKTKQMELNIFFLIERVINKTLVVQHIAVIDSELLTRVLSQREIFQDLKGRY